MGLTCQKINYFNDDRDGDEYLEDLMEAHPTFFDNDFNKSRSVSKDEKERVLYNARKKVLKGMTESTIEGDNVTILLVYTENKNFYCMFHIFENIGIVEMWDIAGDFNTRQGQVISVESIANTLLFIAECTKFFINKFQNLVPKTYFNNESSKNYNLIFNMDPNRGLFKSILKETSCSTHFFTGLTNVEAPYHIINFSNPIFTNKTRSGNVLDYNFIEMIYDMPNTINLLTPSYICTLIESYLKNNYKIKKVKFENRIKVSSFKTRSRNLNSHLKNNFEKEMDKFLKKTNRNPEVDSLLKFLTNTIHYETSGSLKVVEDSKSIYIKELDIFSILEEMSVELISHNNNFEYHTHSEHGLKNHKFVKTWPSSIDLKSIYKNQPNKNHFVFTHEGIYILKFNVPFYNLHNKLLNFPFGLDNLSNIFKQTYNINLIDILSNIGYNFGAILEKFEHENFEGNTIIEPAETYFLWTTVINNFTLVDSLESLKSFDSSNVVIRDRISGYKDYIRLIFHEISILEESNSDAYLKKNLRVIQNYAHILMDFYTKVSAGSKLKFLLDIYINCPVFNVELLQIEMLEKGTLVPIFQ